MERNYRRFQDAIDAAASGLEADARAQLIAAMNQVGEALRGQAGS